MQWRMKSSQSEQTVSDMRDLCASEGCALILGTSLCENVTCSDHGFCVTHHYSGMVKCICDSGYAGDDCQTGAYSNSKLILFSVGIALMARERARFRLFDPRIIQVGVMFLVISQSACIAPALTVMTSLQA